MGPGTVSRGSCEARSRTSTRTAPALLTKRSSRAVPACRTALATSSATMAVTCSSRSSSDHVRMVRAASRRAYSTASVRGAARKVVSVTGSDLRGVSRRSPGRGVPEQEAIEAGGPQDVLDPAVRADDREPAVVVARVFVGTDQDVEPGGVTEVDRRQIDDEVTLPRVDQLRQPFAQLVGRVQIDRTARGNRHTAVLS